MTFHPLPALARAVLLAGALALCTVGLSTPAFAQSGDTQAASAAQLPKEAVKKLQAKRSQIRQLRSQLRKIEKQATVANPDLQDKQEKYRDLVIKNMKDDSFDPKAEMKRMHDLQSELQTTKGLGPQQRQEKIQELQKKKQKFQIKQRQAMQTDEVKTARAALVKDMKSAMQQQDPGFQEKVARLNELEHEYRALLRQVLKNQDGNAETSQGG